MSVPARRTDPVTSWAAGLQAHTTRQTLQASVLDALQTFGPMTHDQIIATVRRVRPASESGVRTRVKELVDAGRVEPVPDMVSKSRLGRASLLWRIVQ